MNQHLRYTRLRSLDPENVPLLNKSNNLIIPRISKISYDPDTEIYGLDMGLEIEYDRREMVGLLVKPLLVLSDSNYEIVQIRGDQYSPETSQSLVLELRHRTSLYVRSMNAAQLRYDRLSWLNKLRFSVSDLFTEIYNEARENALKNFSFNIGDPICTIRLYKQILIPNEIFK